MCNFLVLQKYIVVVHAPLLFVVYAMDSIGAWLCVYFIIRDEYKEFEKLIQEDLKEVDDRLEEEEVTPYYLAPFCFPVGKFNNDIDSDFWNVL